MAMLAVLLCVNLASCSSSEDDPTEEPEEGGVVVSGKRITKIVGMSKNGDSEIYTFKYDNKGRLIEATELCKENEYEETYTYNFTWGDDFIIFDESWSNKTYTKILTLKNGLVQNVGDSDFFTYNKTNRFVSTENGYSYTTTAVWDDDKLMSIFEAREGDYNIRLTYGTTCEKGYFPFIATLIGGYGCELLFVAHPNIAGMRTTQLPSSVIITNIYGNKTSNTYTYAFAFDKKGYITEMTVKGTDGSTWIYTLTWE